MSNWIKENYDWMWKVGSLALAIVVLLIKYTDKPSRTEVELKVRSEISRAPEIIELKTDIKYIRQMLEAIEKKLDTKQTKKNN